MTRRLRAKKREKGGERMVDRGRIWAAGKEKKRKEVERDGLRAGLKEKRAGFGKGKREKEGEV
jgi:hypothetical protein